MRYLIFTITCFWITLGCATVANKKCSDPQNIRIHDAKKIVSLESLKVFWNKHGDCIDGTSYEAYSEAVGDILDKKWEYIVNSNLLKENSIMQALQAGVTDVWEYNLSKRILKNAKLNCTLTAAPLCEKIIKGDSSANDGK